MLLPPVTTILIAFWSFSTFAYEYNFDLTHLKAYDATDSSHITCIMALLRKYFQSVNPLSGSVITMSFTTESTNIQEDILRAMHAQPYLPWTIVVRNPNPIMAGRASTAILHEKPQCYLTAVENLEYGDLEEVYEEWKSSINWNPIAQFVVYLTVVEENDQNMNDLMMAIMLIFMQRKVYNINVIGRHKGVHYFCGKTVFPYHLYNNCGTRVIRIETLDICYYGTPLINDEQGVEAHNEDDDADENGNGDKNSGDDGSINDEENGDGSVEISAKEDGNVEGEREIAENEDIVGYKEKESVKGIRNEDEKGHDEKYGDLKADGGYVGKEKNEDNTAVNEDRNDNLGEGIGSEEADVKEGKERGLVICSDKGVVGYRNMGENKNAYSIEDEKEIQDKITNENMDEELSNMGDTTTSKIKLQELYRGMFSDKIPKDLSGCPIVAAYRPWEPYIFKELNTNNFAPTTMIPKDQTSNAKSAEDSKNYVIEYAYAASNEDDNYAERDSEPDAYNDVDTMNTNAKPAAAPTYKMNGIEYQLIQTIAKVLNIKIDLQVANDNLYVLFQQLIDGEIELIFGGIDEDPGISQYVSSAIPYHQDDLTWCVAKAQRNYQLFNIFQSFHTNTWILTMVFILIVTMNVCLSQKLLKIRLLQCRGIFATFARICGIVLSQSTTIGHLTNSLRLTFICTFFFSLMFMNFYQSVLVSTLTTPESSYQISHLEEIYHNRMTVTGSVENVRHLNKDCEIFKYIRENFKMCHNIEECLNNAAHDERIAVAVSRQHSFYNPRIQRDHLYCFDRNENIYMYLVTMLLPKKYHLLHKINPIIQHVMESGHMEKWARDLDMKRKIREKIRQAQMVTVKELTIQQVVGCFALHAMILALALLVFLVEWWTNWMVVKRRTRLRLVKMLHRKFYEM